MAAGTRVYGIVAAQNQDSQGETIDLNGLEDKLVFQRDEHSPDQVKAFEIIGTIDSSKKIFSEKDCETPQHKQCWDIAKVPFLFGAGVLFDGEGHPNATSAAAILRYCNANGGDLKPGWSVDGSILERKNPHGQVVKDGKTLAKTIAVSAAFTISPANPICRGALFVEQSLQKSSKAVGIPEGYVDLLKKSQAKTSFNQIISEEDLQVFAIQKLRKSIENYNNGFTTLKCFNCNKSGRYFKSLSEIPNACTCGKHFSVSDIWNALNQ